MRLDTARFDAEGIGHSHNKIGMRSGWIPKRLRSAKLDDQIPSAKKDIVKKEDISPLDDVCALHKRRQNLHRRPSPHAPSLSSQ